MSTLITGADGHLGRRFLAAALDAGEPCIAWVHAGDGAALAAKRAALHARWPTLSVIGGDLRRADAFADAPRGLSGILHAAAVTRFDVDQDEAEAVNVAGVDRLLAHAARCPGLQRIDLLGSLYAAGLSTGALAEGRLAPPGWANAYEASKWRMEELAATRWPSLPWRVWRLGASLADDHRGRVGRQNAIHHALKLSFCGLLSVLPGTPACPLHLQSAAHAVGLVRALRDQAPAGSLINACAPLRTVSLGELVERMRCAFLRDAGFRRAGIPAPLWVDQERFAQLADHAAQLTAPLTAAALRAVLPFSRQLAAPKRLLNPSAATCGFAGEDVAALIDATCAWLVASRFGRQAIPEDACDSIAASTG